MEGKGRLTPKGNLAKPDVVSVATWVKEAWDSIPAPMVAKSFLKTSISNNLDGSEDDHLWQKEEDEKSGEVEERKTWGNQRHRKEDVSPEALKEWGELVGESDDDENLDGF